MNTKEVLRVVRDAVSSHTGCEKELYEELDAEADGCDKCTDHYCGDEYGDEPHGPPEFGCCLPLGECCTPGSYARGQDSGIVAALTALRANLKPPNA